MTWVFFDDSYHDLSNYVRIEVDGYDTYHIQALDKRGEWHILSKQYKDEEHVKMLLDGIMEKVGVTCVGVV